MRQILEGLALAFCSMVDVLKELAHPCQFLEAKRGEKCYILICTERMCLKQLFAKQVPVTEWPAARALPSTPLLLNVFGMWEKLVTPEPPILQRLSRLRSECFKAKAV